MEKNRHKSGDVVPPGEYASTQHLDATSCSFSGRRLTTLDHQAPLPSCRCGQVLLWQPFADNPR